MMFDTDVNDGDPVDLGVQNRCAVTIGLLLGGVVLLFIVSCAWGEINLTILQLIDVLGGRASQVYEFIIYTLRLPRALIAVIAGFALGMSGAIFQSISRNPLASPDIIGFNAGAALGAVITLSFISTSSIALTLGGVLGGLTIACLVFVLSWDNGFNAYRVILVGIGAGFAAYAGVDFLMTRSNLAEASEILHWLAGSLNSSTWQQVGISGVGVFILIPIALGFQRDLNMLELGADLAQSLGVKVQLTQLIYAGIGTLFSAIAVSVVGPIGFVAFVSGPIARRLVVPSNACLFSAGLVGAIILLTADLMGRLLFAPLQLPAGIFTALIGAPYLLWFICRQLGKDKE